jgi:hypothetical protein
MLANRILNILLSITYILVIPVQFITTFVLGLLVTISFGILLFPISLIWILLSFPMIGVSWLTSKIKWLRVPLGLLGIPWAFVANIFVALMPSMGELESRAAKLMLTCSWPYSWEFWQFQGGKTYLFDAENKQLEEIIDRRCRMDPLMRRTITRITSGEALDPNT